VRPKSETRSLPGTLARVIANQTARDLRRIYPAVWAGIFSLALVCVKLLLKARLGILDRQQFGQRSLECLTANSADSDRWNAS
jgi:peptidoglycan/LPS O-acetylase OafA/YrhL